MGWFAESRRKSADGELAEGWSRIGGPYKSQERTKAECKAVFLAEPQNATRIEFRTVADDERGTVYQECKPPHGTRLRWTNAAW